MERSRNRQKPSDVEQNMPSIDRISGLPDSILCHILSFLPTKDSVETSILARRWKFLWAYVPNLDFRRVPKIGSNVINRIMLLHKVQSIITFRLCYYANVYDEYQFQSWVKTAISRNVQNLHIYLGKIVMLPRCLFTCETLVDLRLRRCGGFHLTGAVCLPRLKKLYLNSVQYGGDESLTNLLSGCPVLEELSLRNILYEDLVCCYISSPTIKRLNLDFKGDDFEHYTTIFDVEINTPALRYLQVKEYASKHVKAGALTSLIEADIDIRDDRDKENEDLYSQSFLEFVDRLCNVKRLKFNLYHCTTEIVGSAFSAPSVRFHNLKKLELIGDWRLLLKFLENADNIEILVYREVCEAGLIEPKLVPTCILSHLRTVRIVEMEGEQELKIIRYLLSNGQVLERMEIMFSVDFFDFEKEAETVEKISQFERGSEACEVAFC